MAARLESLLEWGANVNEVENEFHLNLLQKCIIDDYSLDGEHGAAFAKIVDKLLDYGIDLNHQDVDGCTALHFAICEEQYNLAEILIKNGANPAITDKRGETAWDDLKNLRNPDPLKASERQDLLHLIESLCKTSQET